MRISDQESRLGTTNLASLMAMETKAASAHIAGRLNLGFTPHICYINGGGGG
jgi:hypothetical protein